TFRYRTAAEVENMQRVAFPTFVKYATDLNRILRDMGKDNRAVEIANATRVRGNDNTLKNYTGTLTGFETFKIVTQRQNREADLASYVAAHPEAKKYADVVNQMNKLEEEHNATQQRDTVVTWLFRGSPMLTQASSLYRLSLERPKADIDRIQGYQERDWPRISEAMVRAQKQMEPQSDRAGLRYFFLESQKLSATQRITAVDDLVAKNGGVDKFLN